MQAATATQRDAGGKEAPLVVIPQPEGFHVYAADNPEVLYEVSGGPEAPLCSCPEFTWRSRTPGYRCRHVEAVFRDLERGAERPSGNGQEHPGIPVTGAAGNGEALADGIQMLLKRSVSPDGRIDSFSVEFTIPVGGLRDAQLEEFALTALVRQDAIATAFLDSRGEPGQRPQAAKAVAGNGPKPGMLREVSGMQTKYGWRYYLNVEIEGRNYKLFGSRRQLAEQITQAGLGHFADNVAKGVTFDAPCRAVLAPSEDGRYTNVESLLPAAHAGTGR